jgi:cytochrome c553
MSCEDCHFFREDGTYAGKPALSACVECHEEPQGETES